MTTFGTVIYRVIGACILIQSILFCRYIQALWTYVHQGVRGKVATAISIFMFVSAVVGAVTLLLPKRWAPYIIYASYLCLWVGGVAFSYVPGLFHFVPRGSRGLALVVGNSAVVLCLAVAQFINWRKARRVATTGGTVGKAD